MTGAWDDAVGGPPGVHPRVHPPCTSAVPGAHATEPDALSGNWRRFFFLSTSPNLTGPAPRRTARILQHGCGSLLEGLTFKVANACERGLAFEFRRVVYEEQFGHLPIDDLDELAHHLVATNENGEIIAAVRIVGPDQRPFDLERYVELAQFIPKERIPAMIGRFCIRRDYRGVSKRSFVPMGMFKLSYAFARQQGLTDLLTYAYRNLYHFYRGAFFEPMIRGFDHPTWGTVTVMRLDLDGLEARYRESKQPFAHFLLRAKLPNILL